MTEKWKEVWDKPVHPSWMLVSLQKEGDAYESSTKFPDPPRLGKFAYPQKGLTYGPHVAALMAQGVLANPNNSQGYINWGEVLRDAKELCKEIAEMEGE